MAASLELNLYRLNPTTNDTIGKIMDESNIFFCHTMEDEFRRIKKSRETRIPALRYRLGIREEITSLTQKYLNDERLKPWFERHIEILNVPGFKGVYIHIGNHEGHTDACVLVGLWSGDLKIRYISKSVHVYKHFYLKYYPIIKKGEIEVYLNVHDEANIIMQ